MDDETKRCILDAIVPLYMKEDQDSITLYFPNTGPKLQSGDAYLGIPLRIQKLADGRYKVIGKDPREYITKPEFYTKNKEWIGAIYDYLGVKEMPDPSDGVYMDAYSLLTLGEIVFKMLANISAIQKFGGITKAVTRVMRNKNTKD